MTTARCDDLASRNDSTAMKCRAIIGRQDGGASLPTAAAEGGMVILTQEIFLDAAAAVDQASLAEDLAVALREELVVALGEEGQITSEEGEDSIMGRTMAGGAM